MERFQLNPYFWTGTGRNSSGRDQREAELHRPEGGERAQADDPIGADGGGADGVQQPAGAHAHAGDAGAHAEVRHAADFGAGGGLVHPPGGTY